MARLVVYDRLGNNYPRDTVIGSAAAPNWTIPPGRTAPMIMPAVDSIGWEAGISEVWWGSGPLPSPKDAAYWSANPFAADQWCRVSHDPMQGNASGDERICGPVVRNVPGQDTCYVLYTRYHQAGMLPDGQPIGCTITQVLDRVNNGVVTEIARWNPPNYTCLDDWWFQELHVWGQDPVRFRVIHRAPIEYVVGSVPPPYDSLPSFQALQYLYQGITKVHDVPTNPYHFRPPPDHTPFTTPAAGDRDRVWVVWEGFDDSADRILTGQPGFRWGGSLGPKTAEDESFNFVTQIGIAKFAAGELGGVSIDELPTVDGATATVSGFIAEGQTVAVTCPAATVGAVAHPTTTTWEVTLTDLSPGLNVVTATASGGDTAEATIILPESGAASYAAALAITQDASYTVYGGSTAFVSTLRASLDAVYAAPASTVDTFPALLGSSFDAAYSDSIDGGFLGRFGALVDAEAMPPLPLSWLARVTRSALSWVAGPFQPFILNPATLLDFRSVLGMSADARVDYHTYDGFRATLGVSTDAAFGEAFADGPDPFSSTLGAQYDATFFERVIPATFPRVRIGIAGPVLKLSTGGPSVRASIAPGPRISLSLLTEEP